MAASRMILGFTGTRAGMTDAQLRALRGVISTYPEILLHGGAPGADEEADAFFAVGCTGTKIEVYPASAQRAGIWLRKTDGVRVIHNWMKPLVRDVIIAKRCDHLLACPGTQEEIVRSGTWSTVRYARKVGKPITILMPDGTAREERR